LREQSAPGGTLCSISPYSPYGASPSMSHMPGQERVHDTSLAQLPEVTLTAASTQSSCGGGQGSGDGSGSMRARAAALKGGEGGAPTMKLSIPVHSPMTPAQSSWSRPKGPAVEPQSSYADQVTPPHPYMEMSYQFSTAMWRVHGVFGG